MNEIKYKIEKKDYNTYGSISNAIQEVIEDRNGFVVKLKEGMSLSQQEEEELFKIFEDKAQGKKVVKESE